MPCSHAAGQGLADHGTSASRLSCPLAPTKPGSSCAAGALPRFGILKMADRVGVEPTCSCERPVNSRVPYHSGHLSMKLELATDMRHSILNVFHFGRSDRGQPGRILGFS